MSKHDDDLQRYFDGELDEPERRRVEAALTDDDRERLAALAEIKALTAGALLAEAGELDLWPAVEAGLRAERGDKQQRTRRWRDRVRGRFLAGTGAGLLVAAAATVLLFFGPWPAGARTATHNNVEIESMEVDGVSAAVLTMADVRHGNGDTTILFTTEED